MNVSVSQYAPGSAAAIAAGSDFYDLTSQCTSTSNKVVFQYDDVTLPPGIYYADCGFYIRLDNVTGSVTFAASGPIDVKLKNDTNISAYVDATLMITDSTLSDAIFLNGSYSNLEGRLIAEFGTAEISGSLHDFNCGIFANKINFSGSKHDMFELCPLLQNLPPVANDDLVDTYVDQLVAIDVLLNDSDSDGTLNSSTIAIASAPVNGTAVVSAGVINYTPASGFSGTEFFDYTVNDNDGAISNVANVRVEVSVPNEPPVLGADAFTVVEDTLTVLDIFANDVDAESAIDYGSLVITVSPVNGLLTIDETNNVANYTPDADFVGSDQFEYHVADDEGLFAPPVLVAITIQAVNDAPVASPAAVSTNEDVSVVVALIAEDVEGDSLALTVDSQPSSGVLTGDFPNLTYTPQLDFSGSDSFSFSVSDGSLQSNSAIVSITVNAENDIPTGTAQSVNVLEDSSIGITLAGGDVDGDALTFSAATIPMNGVLSGTEPNLTYTPNANFFGLDSFTFTASDGTAVSAAQTVSITVDPVNDLPVAFSQSLMVDEDNTLAVMLMGSDTEAGSLSFTVDSQPGNGTLTGIAPDLTYTPNAEYFGNDSFQFSVIDGELAAASAVVSIAIVSVNDAPIAITQSVGVAEDSTAAITLVGSDADGDGLAFSVADSPENGVLVGSGANRTYSPNANFFGADSFSFSVNDGTVASDAVVVNIDVTSVNDVPVTDPQSLSMLQDASLSVLLTGADVDGDQLTYAVSTPPGNGSLAGSPPNLTYTPSVGFSGLDTFAFTANDGAASSAPSLVSIDVMSTSTNMAPYFVQLPLLRAEQGRTYRSQGEVADMEGDLVTVSVVNGPVGATINDLGSNRFELVWPVVGDVGTAQSMTLRASDGNGGITDEQIAISIGGNTIDQSTLGTDFWLAFFRNGFYNTRPGGYPILSDQRYLQIMISAPDGAIGTVEIDELALEPGTSFYQAFDLQPGESVVVDFPRNAVALATVSDAIHVTSDRPVMAAGFNWSRSSSDAWLAIPTAALGTSYQIGAYEAADRGPETQVGLVSVASGLTTVTTTPEIGLAARENQSANTPFDLTFDDIGRARVSGTASHYSSQINSDQPIAVFAGSYCANIPFNGVACDHLIEQLTPESGLASEYVVAPLATRGGGAIYRVIATEDDTTVTVNGALVGNLLNGERVDRATTGPVHVVADKPVLLLQFAPSNTFDSGLRTPDLDPLWADPFMLQVAPIDAYLDDYVFSVIDNTIYPSESAPSGFVASIERHFVGVTIRQADVGSLVINGLPVDTTEFTAIGDTGFLAGSIELLPGNYRASANGLFGLTSYGFGNYDSYGYYTGLAFPSTETGLSLAITSADSSADAGEEACFAFEVTNALGQRVPRARFEASIVGVLDTGRVGFANGVGIGQFCYSQELIGQDTVTVAVDGDSQTVLVDWLAGPGVADLPPVFTSEPPYVLYDPVYLYDVIVQNAAGGNVTIEVTQGPNGLQYDDVSGQINWMPEIPVDRNSTEHPVIITATNANGESAVQVWTITVHYPPIIESFTNTTTITDLIEGRVNAIGGDFLLTNIVVTDGPIAGSSLRWEAISGVVEEGLWSYDVVVRDVQAREQFGGNNRLCVAPNSRVNGYQAQRIRSFDVAATNGLAVGPAVDSNNDGVVDAADDIYVFAVDRSELSLTNLTTNQIAWRYPIVRSGFNSAPSMANLDGDAEMEFLVVANVGAPAAPLPVAFDTDGTVLWTGAFDVHADAQAQMERPLLVHDLNGDGTVEIIAGGYVLDNTGNLLWQFPPETTGGIGWNAEFAIATVADLDGDGQSEVMYGNQVRRADGSLYWDISATGLVDQHALFGVGDLDQDGDLDVVTVSGDGSFSTTERGFRVDAWHADGTPMWGPVESRGMSVPVIGDIDADGDVEVYIADDQLTISSDGGIEHRSGGSIANRDTFHRLPIIDLNGDGVYERFLHSDRRNFDVLSLAGSDSWLSDASFGRDIADEELQRGFAIADIDHDGSLDMVIGSDGSLAVFESASQSWVGSPRDYRQFSDIGQTSFGIDVLAATLASQNRSDYWVGELAVSIANETQVMLQARVSNRGMAPIAETGTLRFHQDHADSGTLVGSIAIPPLGIGETVVLSVVVDRTNVTDVMSASIEPHASTLQCETGNDSVEAVYFEFEITDTGEELRTDQSRFFARALAAEGNPFVFGVASNATIVATQTHTDRILADVDGAGDVVAFTIARPGSLGIDVPMPVIDPFSGDIEWTPTQSAVGEHTFTVTATSLRNRRRPTMFTWTVLPRPNTAPEIISSPSTLSIGEEDSFTYNVVATDADNDSLSYALQVAPVGMTIDAVTGVINWTTTFADVGDNTVEIRVDDGFGGSDLQSFIVNVSEMLNVAPDITSTPSFGARVGTLYTYQVVATDADGDTLVYTLPDAPSGMTIDAAGLLSWTPGTIGSESVIVRVSDGMEFINQGWTIDVVDGSQPFDATLYVAPSTVDLGESVSVSYIIDNAAGDLAFSLTIDGNSVPISQAGTASYVTDRVGVINVSATVSDSTGTITRTGSFTVTDPGNVTDAPVVVLTTPVDGQKVTAPTDVIGTVTDDNLASWTLYLLPTDRPVEESQVIATGTNTLTDSVVGNIDPTQMLNGLYRITLQAEDLSGNVTAVAHVIRVDGDMKVGNFSVTFEDVSIPLEGIPISVQRTYDSRRRNESLDFGYGWTVDYQNVRVQESRDLGFAWDLIEERQGLFTRFCVRPAGDPTVTVRLPDGELDTFIARAEPECSNFGAQVNVQLQFDPIDGTDSSLEVVDTGLIRIVNGQLVDPGEPDTPVDPSLYRLTTPEGMEYDLDQAFGIRQIRDTQGNSITYSDIGIVHSNGFAVDFVRDAFGRIEGVLLPDGTSLQYDFDAAGDLVQFTDQVNQSTTFTYLTALPHYLEDINDPRGIRVARNEYDANGRLIAHIDADNNRIEYTHDIVGRTESVRNRRGHTTTYVYDDEGNVLVETNPESESITRTYDDDHNMLTEANDLGHTMIMTYDARGNVLTEQNDLGQITINTYNDRSLLETVTDGAGHLVMSNVYDTINTNLLSTTDGEGGVTAFDWDSRIGSCGTGASRGYTDAEDGVLEIQPFCAGPFAHLPWFQIDQRGLFTWYDHDPVMGRLDQERTTRTDANGVVHDLITTMVYDDKGRVTRVTDPEGNVTHTEYNAIDKVAATVSEATAGDTSRRTEYEYDNRGNLVLTRYPDATTETMTYDPEGNVVSQTDRQGRTTRMEYDRANRLTATIYPDDTPGDDTDNPRTSTAYDAIGRVQSTTDERGHATTYEYDNAGRRTAVITHLGERTTFEYDARGLRVAMVDARLNRTEYVYDRVGRLTDTIFDDLERSTTTYDRLGRKTAEIDRDGMMTLYEYDPLGNLTAVVEEGPQRTEYEYDEQSNKTVQRDANLRATRWSHDNLGRVTMRTLPMGQAELFTYDGVGNMLTRRDFNTALTTYTYDEMDRVRTAIYDDGAVVTTTYTDNGLVEDVTDENGTTSNSYDVRDRLIRIDYPNGSYIDYAYDPAGNRIALTTAEQSITYSYDQLNRLDTVTDAEGITDYTYDAVGNRERVDHANGTYTTYVYDNLNRLTVLSVFDATDTLLNQHTYTLGLSGHRTQLDETLRQPDGSVLTRSTAYVYDDVYRLLSETLTDTVNGNRTTSWAYDAVGNRQSETVDGVSTSYTYDFNDRVDTVTTATGVTSYEYDNNGNTVRTNMPDGFITYAWDSRDRMIASEGGAITYTYDAQGIRQSTTANGVTTQYLTDPNRSYAQVIEESDALGNLSVAYTYGDDLVSQHRGTASHTYHYDGLGSTRALSDATGALTDSYRYTAFGEDDGSVGTTDNAYRYTGEQYDANVGFYYLRARYYNASLGRFHSMDTYAGRMHEPATLHKYLYVHADPVNMVDPSGLVGLSDISASLQAASNLASSVLSAVGLGLRVQSAADLVIMTLHIGQLARSGNLAKAIRETLSESASSNKSVSRASFDDAIDSLLRHSNDLFTLSFTHWAGYLGKHAGSIDRFVIYLPQVVGGYREIPLFRSGRFRTALVLDGKGKGRMTGVGVGMKRKRQAQQIWRMDFHSLHTSRNPGADAEYIVDRQFHYHVRKPPK